MSTHKEKWRRMVIRLCNTISKLFFFFNDTATTEIYTLSLHDALPISVRPAVRPGLVGQAVLGRGGRAQEGGVVRSEEHTSELQSQSNLVCRLLLEKKKNEQLNTA